MKALIEKTLTRIPMYLLVSGSLWVLVVGALLCSSLNLTGFGPVELIVSVVVFCAASVGTSYLFGKLYGIHSHLQSALITGLILALLYTPSFDIFVLLQYALIATIAIGSKFVIAPFRRHIFNPAAFGAFMGGLLGLQYASWWIGSPAFVLLVTIMSLIVLYKTRQLILGLIFVPLAAFIIIVNGLLHSEPLSGLVMTALASWPLIFMAGFMLSEPLTLPPQRNQRIILAVIVAIVTSLPFQIAWFNSSPAFALLIGNIFALAIVWRQRRGLHLTLTERRSLTPTVKEFTFSSAKPIEFKAGQYVELTLPHTHQDIRGIRRSFSITSRPGEQQLRLAVKFYEPGSTFKHTLLNLPIGTHTQATGISGDFTLPKRSRQKLLFIAGGIGITPFISHIRSLAGKKTDIVVLYFNRKPSDTAYKDFLDASSAKVHYFAAQKAEDGFIESPHLSDDVLHTYIHDLSEREVYISGAPAMVARAKRVIGKRSHRIHTDYFSGY